MDKDTLKALHGSIAKWEAVAAGTDGDRGPENCPLCTRFLENYCEGCPVRETTAQPYCRSTPYIEWCRSTLHVQRANGHGRFATNRKTRALAKREVKFLKSLLSKES